MIVLSTKYVEELRSLPNSKISAIQALISVRVSFSIKLSRISTNVGYHPQNLGYSQSELLLESDLHFQTLQKRVTPNLHTFVTAMKEDIDYSIKHDFPDVGGKTRSFPYHTLATDRQLNRDLVQWKVVKLHELMAKLVQRLSARVFVGEPACRDPAWLEASTKYVENASLTVFIMRATPGWMQRVVVTLLPCYWGAASWGNKAISVLIPVIQARREAPKDKAGVDRHDFLQGMINLANEHDGTNQKLARRALIMELASIHLTTMAAEHVLYDIFARPEYLEPLREEVESALADDDGCWSKGTFAKLRKLDSILRESQRLSPPSLLAMHRIVQNDPVRLSDGKVLRPGQHICLAAYETSKDPSIVAGDEFDGLRSWRMRERGRPEDAQKHQFANIDREHLHFGVGNNVCPGRWLASNLLKMIIGEMLLRFDLKFLDGCG